MHVMLQTLHYLNIATSMRDGAAFEGRIFEGQKDVEDCMHQFLDSSDRA